MNLRAPPPVHFSPPPSPAILSNRRSGGMCVGTLKLRHMPFGRHRQQLREDFAAPGRDERQTRAAGLTA